MEEATAGGLQQWKRGYEALAGVILRDQFTRCSSLPQEPETFFMTCPNSCMVRHTYDAQCYKKHLIIFPKRGHHGLCPACAWSTDRTEGMPNVFRVWRVRVSCCRNVFRGTPRMFSLDQEALSLAKSLVVSSTLPWSYSKCLHPDNKFIGRPRAHQRRPPCQYLLVL